MSICLRGVSIDVAATRIVHDVHLEAGTSEIVGIVGPNGCGKSTLLKALYRVLAPSCGMISAHDVDVTALPLHSSARLIAALPQDEHGELDFTVAETVRLGRFARRGGARTDEAICRAAMERTDVLQLAGRSILTLSGGERQRVLVARALAQDTPVLVLDEPTNHLDLRHQISLLRTLRDLAACPRAHVENGSTRVRTTIVMAIHDLNLALAACDQIVLMGSGTVHSAGPAAQVLTAEAIEQTYGVRPQVVTHPSTGNRHLLFTV